MKTYHGLGELLLNKEKLADVGWLFIEKSFNSVSRNDILNRNFFFAENDDEEIGAERRYKTWLESPTFLDILDVVQEKNPAFTTNELIEAIVYYIEHDAFMD